MDSIFSKMKIALHFNALRYLYDCVPHIPIKSAIIPAVCYYYSQMEMFLIILKDNTDFQVQL